MSYFQLLTRFCCICYFLLCYCCCWYYSCSKWWWWKHRLDFTVFILSLYSHLFSTLHLPEYCSLLDI